MLYGKVQSHHLDLPSAKGPDGRLSFIRNITLDLSNPGPNPTFLTSLWGLHFKERAWPKFLALECLSFNFTGWDLTKRGERRFVSNLPYKKRDQDHEMLTAFSYVTSSRNLIYRHANGLTVMLWAFGN